MQSLVGDSVAIDGNVIVVGAEYDQDGIFSVHVYRHNESTGIWSQEVKLGSDDGNLQRFGSNVAVKGNILAVGDVRYGTNDQGSVFVYEYSPLSGNWTGVGSILLNLDCDNFFGSSLAVMEDGALAIGCHWEDSYSDVGAVYHYILSGTSVQYTFQQKVTQSDRAVTDCFGGSDQIAIYRNVMAVGASCHWSLPSSEVCNERVLVYTRPIHSDIRMEVTEIPSPDGEVDFGNTVGLFGTQPIIGAGNNAYVYTLEVC